MAWRTITDILKRKPLALRIADALGRGRGDLRWLDDWNAPPRPLLASDLSDWESRDLSAVWIGHATVLIRIGGKTILTDPVLGPRVGLGLFLMTLGPRRHIAAALTAKRLPPLDLILLSHAHFDHLDRPTLAQLPRKTPVITAPHTTDLIHDLGYRNITELKWGEESRLGDVRILAHEIKHWGARTFYDRHRGYNSYLIEGGNRRILYAGDTAYQTNFTDVGRVDLAIFGIGAYDPFIQAHANPEQVWEMANHLPADHVLPIHHSTFRLSHEPMDEPLKRLIAAAGNEADKIVVRQIGGGWQA